MGILTAAMANCCFQTLVYIGIEAKQTGTPAAYDAAVSLQQYAVLSSKV
jgi:hypothetical protein